jgi:peptide/nickel transport system substrate-binding protein
MKGSALLTDKAVRQALSLAVDKEKIIREVLLGGGNLINSPIPASFSPYSLVIDSQYSTTDANYLLEKAGWKKQTDGTRQKSKQLLEITLTVTDKTESIKTGELIQKAWQEIGVKTNLNIVAANKIQREVIRTRAYDALLLGEVLGADPDPFSFWHSSQVDPPGLNLSGYANRQIDSLIEEARQTNDQAKRVELYQKFQSLLVKDYPAIFLYSPLYTYALQEQIKGFSANSLIIPADRFNNLADWYIKRKKKLW